MLTPNLSYANLKESYLFYHIAQKTKAYLAEHPDTHLYRMGIGDVSLPLVPAVIEALHEAVDDQGEKARFHGYMPECGDPSLRETIAKHYRKRDVFLSPEDDRPALRKLFAFSGRFRKGVYHNHRHESKAPWAARTEKSGGSRSASVAGRSSSGLPGCQL